MSTFLLYTIVIVLLMALLLSRFSFTIIGNDNNPINPMNPALIQLQNQQLEQQQLSQPLSQYISYNNRPLPVTQNNLYGNRGNSGGIVGMNMQTPFATYDLSIPTGAQFYTH